MFVLYYALWDERCPESLCAWNYPIHKRASLTSLDMIITIPLQLPMGWKRCGVSKGPLNLRAFTRSKKHPQPHPIICTDYFSSQDFTHRHCYLFVWWLWMFIANARMRASTRTFQISWIAMWFHWHHQGEICLHTPFTDNNNESFMSGIVLGPWRRRRMCWMPSFLSEWSSWWSVMLWTVKLRSDMVVCWDASRRRTNIGAAVTMRPLLQKIGGIITIAVWNWPQASRLLVEHS